MQTLLNDKFYPITSSIAFMEADMEKVCTGFLNWQQKLITEMAPGYTLVKKEIRGGLEEAFSSLLPLYTHEPRRHLFVPTRSGWVAYFNNFILGTDAGALVGYLPTFLHCRSLLVKFTSDTELSKDGHTKKRNGTMVFDLHGPDIVNYQNTIRKVSLVNEGKKWVFYQQGDPLPFEDTSHYNEKLTKKKFTYELLLNYTNALGLEPFTTDFYLPAGGHPSVLIEKQGPVYPDMRSVNLEEI